MKIDNIYKLRGEWEKMYRTLAFFYKGDILIIRYEWMLGNGKNI